MTPHISFSIIFLHLSTNYFLWPPLTQTRIYHWMKPRACNKAAGQHNVSPPHPFIAHGRTFNKAQTLGQVHKALRPWATEGPLLSSIRKCTTISSSTSELDWTFLIWDLFPSDAGSSINKKSSIHHLLRGWRHIHTKIFYIISRECDLLSRDIYSK